MKAAVPRAEIEDPGCAEVAERSLSVDERQYLSAISRRA
jgi:hypothetical protein